MPSALPTLCYGGRCQQKSEESVTSMDPIIQLRTGPATPLLNPAPHPSLHGLRTIRGAASIQAFLHILLETAVPHPPPSSNNPDHVCTGTISLITQPLLGHSPGLRPPTRCP